jgi:hypothetical protein
LVRESLVSSFSPINPVVDHLADLALWEAELAADSAAVDSVAPDPLSVASSLLNRLRRVPDPRRLRGLRHPLLVILVLTACATLVVGNDSVTAIRQWAARTPQDVLHRLGAWFNPLRGRYTVPHEDDSQLRTGTAPRAHASFRNLALNTFRLAGRANIAHARRDLHDRTDTFAVYGI